jgi:hypothetical protein
MVTIPSSRLSFPFSLNWLGVECGKREDPFPIIHSVQCYNMLSILGCHIISDHKAPREICLIFLFMTVVFVRTPRPVTPEIDPPAPTLAQWKERLMGFTPEIPESG